MHMLLRWCGLHIYCPIAVALVLLMLTLVFTLIFNIKFASLLALVLIHVRAALAWTLGA